MVLLFHIGVALFSMAYTTYLFFFPTNLKLYISYGLVALTIGSGTYLVVTKPVHILQTCMTGLLYIGVMTVGILAARHRLATQKVTIRPDF